jgi:hypothetical protein
MMVLPQLTKGLVTAALSESSLLQNLNKVASRDLAANRDNVVNLDCFDPIANDHGSFKESGHGMPGRRRDRRQQNLRIGQRRSNLCRSNSNRNLLARDKTRFVAQDNRGPVLRLAVPRNGRPDYFAANRETSHERPFFTRC